MKKTICFIIITLLLSGKLLFAQNIDLSSDSVTSLLCKKWEVDYALMGGMKIGRLPGATEINYEFYRDKTFLMTSNNPKDKMKGTWIYDPKKKTIKLTANGKSNTSIISLKEKELIMLADTKNVTPDDPTDVMIVYKIKP